jgi:hypothetical protein
MLPLELPAPAEAELLPRAQFALIEDPPLPLMEPALEPELLPEPPPPAPLALPAPP